MTRYTVAIDGPAVSGKSSAAKQLAGRLGWLYLDSGAVYRCITLAHLRGLIMEGKDLESKLDDLKIQLVPLGAGQGCRIEMGEEDVNQEIRTQKVSDQILPISGNPRVRAWVVEFLRHLARGQSVVMDGRDIASVVFPDADYKFFVTASVEARAKRRKADLGPEEDLDLASIAKAIEERDYGDQHRKVGPLVQVPQATEVDNSKLGLSETVDIMYRQILEGQEETS
jgi:CMP/dCMP kinase